jgi:hypothetical protein
MVSAGLLFSGQGAARADGTGPEAMTMGNMCMVMFGYEMIHITATQPEKSRADYCEEIPATGNTVMVFDIENPKLREFPIELRIIKDPLSPITKDTDLEALTEVHFPAKKYPRGTFNFQHDFKNTGHYVTLVTITREDGTTETSDLKFQVGETLWSWVPQIAGTILIGGLLFAYWKHSTTTKNKQPTASA